MDQIPRAAHVALDYVLAILLIALPFLAGFSDETAPTALFIGVGILHLLVTIGTRFRTRDERAAGGGDRRPARNPGPAGSRSRADSPDR
mgnify:FL=1